MTQKDGVNIHASGDLHIGGDIVGRDKITGGGGEVSCDFIWRGATLKGLCFPEDQRDIQRRLNKFLEGVINFETLKKQIFNLSESLWSQIERIEKERTNDTSG